MKDVFNESIKLRNNIIKFRKWKAKDRKKFIKLVVSDKAKEAAECLVYDCIENPIPLSQDEFRYVLSQIRKSSVSDKVLYDLSCDNCKKKYSVELKIDDILKPEYKEYAEICIGDISIDIGDVVNKAYYDKALSSAETDSEIYTIDFLYHIRKLNNSDAFTFDYLVEYFDDLDVDILDKIFDEWDLMRFKLNDVNTVVCTNCDTKETYKFDELPGFFPDKWFNR